MRKTVVILTLLVLCAISIKLPVVQAEMGCTTEQKSIMFLLNTKQVYKDGQVYLSKEKHVIKKGTTYVPLRSIAEHLGYTLSYDKKNKQTVMTNGDHILRFSMNSDTFVKNSQKIQYRSGSSYTEKGTLMVPVRDLAKALNVTFSAELSKNRVYLSWNEQLCQEVEKKPTKAVGQIYPINRDSILEFPVIEPKSEYIGGTLIRSNSPERITREGIHYTDKVAGAVRFIIHKQNAIPEPVKVYLVATNHNSHPVHVQLSNVGVGGPSQYVSSAGRASVANYLTSVKENWATFAKILQPGETAVVVPEMSEKSLKQGQTLTAYADLYSNAEIEYKIVALFEETDLMSTLPFLTGDYAIHDGKHKRGTFKHSDNSIVVSELVGDKQSRLVLGDGKLDPYVIGIDKISGKDEVNTGNYGVVYDITLEQVAPNSIIALNPRGGHYAGAFLVNNKVILAPSAGIISGPNEHLILHKTGIHTETVNIKFIPAAGSNLPLSLLFMPDVDEYMY